MDAPRLPIADSGIDFASTGGQGHEAPGGGDRDQQHVGLGRWGGQASSKEEEERGVRLVRRVRVSPQPARSLPLSLSLSLSLSLTLFSDSLFKGATSSSTMPRPGTSSARYGDPSLPPFLSFSLPTPPAPPPAPRVQQSQTGSAPVLALPPFVPTGVRSGEGGLPCGRARRVEEL